jgi:hypothetical protein
MKHAKTAWTKEPTHQGLVPGTASDLFLMPLFVAAGYNNDNLVALNVCRMYLHAVTLSDLATADRIYISQTAWIGQRDCKRASPYY